MKIQELLNSPYKWTRNAFARDVDGIPVSPDSTEAVKWCLVGAIKRCYPLERAEIINKVEHVFKRNPIEYNDTHTYKEVMKVVKELDI